MNRQELIAKLKEEGFDVSTITDETPDSVLSVMLRQLSESNEKVNELNAKVEQQSKTIKAAEENAGGGDGDGDDKEGKEGKKKEDDEEPASKFMEELKAVISPISEKVEKLSERLDSIESGAKEKDGVERKAKIEAFCEQAIKAEKTDPAELDGGLRAQLYDADAVTLRTFKEGDEDVKMTQLDLIMKTIMNRPSTMRFSEKVNDKGGEEGGSDSSKEEKLVVEHYEKHKHSFDLFGTTKENYLKAFSESGQSATSFISGKVDFDSGQTEMPLCSMQG